MPKLKNFKIVPNPYLESGIKKSFEKSRNTMVYIKGKKPKNIHVNNDLRHAHYLDSNQTEKKHKTQKFYQKISRISPDKYTATVTISDKTRNLN